ncbi:MAG: hypothetical protein A3K18_30350 [Lentisphaerae bacterium RIFOXYA12_64_32]|nr:MAG: hypothetical protein A3K18_30350 [Lentisphaerae bacterium RIFOXYA12_64_32]
MIPALWGGLFLCALPGLVLTTERDEALVLLAHLLGVFCYCAAVYWVLMHDPALAGWILNAIVAAMILCCCSGWYQVQFGGLAETEEMARKMQAEQGRLLVQGIGGRLQQRRAFGPFVYPNSFAAHLILITPLFLVVLWRWAGRFDPVRLSRIVFLGFGVALSVGALHMSGSRAGMAAFGAAFGATAVLVPRLGKWRWLAAAACVGVAVVGFILASRGRDFRSMTARTEYYRAAAMMFREHPLTGVGLGEFYPNYLRLKSADAEVSRDAHNMVLSLAAQAGTLGGLAAVACLILPLLQLLWLNDRSRCDPWIRDAVVLGLLAWGLHSLADFNVQIPGTVATASILPLLVLAPAAEAAPSQSASALLLRLTLALPALLAITWVSRLPGEYAYQQLHDQYGRRDLNIGRFQRDAVETARLLPRSPYPWLLLGRVMEATRQHEAAVEAYRKAALNSPHRAALHACLARNYLALGRGPEARAAAEKAVAWYPLFPGNQPLLQEIDQASRQPPNGPK